MTPQRIQCPECGAWIRSDLARCPACGGWAFDPDGEAWADTPDLLKPEY